MNTAVILAIDFFDGATEGFIARRARSSIEYFRIVAWDREHDQRLFLISEVEPRELSRLEDLLRAHDQTGARLELLPAWRFSRPRDAAEADEIIVRCRATLFAAGHFALGLQPDTSVRLAPLSSALQREVERAFNQTTVDNLEHWLALLRP